MITMDRTRFVYFDETGELTKITNYLEDGASSFIKVDYKKVEDILQGTISSFEFIVTYDPSTRDYDIRSKIINNEIINDVNNRIYEIKKNVSDPDITIIQDTTTKCWKFKINQEILNNIVSNNMLISTPLIFSITKKHNPNILYRTFTVNFSDILEDIDFSIPFVYTEEETRNFSIYTVKKMQSYNYEVLDE